MPWGYMGKVPNRGDFITHNLSSSTRDILFEWCQAILAVSKEQLEDRWLDAYLTSPIWHFGMGRGVLSETAVIGTMIPSVDRVGRHFPFVVLSDHAGSPLEAWRKPDWSSAMEECVLAVLDDQWSEDGWRQWLETIEPPGAVQSRLRWPDREGNLMLPGAAREPDWLPALLELNASNSVWWTQGSAYVEPAILLTDGLPKVGQFAAMLIGQWAEHGWQQGALAE